MKKNPMGSGVAIFIIFFGISVLESIRQKDWRWFAACCVMFLAFLILDRIMKKQPDEN